MKRAYFLLYAGSLAITALSFIPLKEKRYISGRNSIVGTPYIVIDKSDYDLKLYDDKGWYATYPVVFGNDSQADKLMEGDRLTPEGEYKIIAKKTHTKWSRFLLINYPNQQNIERFNRMKASGRIPANASIGGGIGIHGTWPREEYAVDRYLNWTDGCIALKREHVEEIYALIPNGTRVTIKK